MSLEMLVEAIDKLDDELIEEYFSYVPDKRIKFFTVLKVAAAIVVVVTGIAAAVIFSGKSRIPEPEKELIVAVKESEGPETSEKPRISQEPQITVDEESQQLLPTEPVQSVEPILPSSSKPKETENSGSSDGISPVPDEEMPQMPDRTESAETPVQREEPSKMPEKENPDTYMVWNKADNRMAPCDKETTAIEAEYYGLIYGLADVSFAPAQIPDWEESDSRLQGWKKEILFRAPVRNGWYWFNTDRVGVCSAYKNCFVLQTEKNVKGAYSNVLLLKEEKKPEKGKLYIMQVQTGAKTLEEANAIYSEEMFADSNLQVSFYNGMRMYLVENDKGELYVRFLINDTLITMIDKGFGKEYIMDLVKNVREVPEIDRNS